MKMETNLHNTRAQSTEPSPPEVLDTGSYFAAHMLCLIGLLIVLSVVLYFAILLGGTALNWGIIVIIIFWILTVLVLLIEIHNYVKKRKKPFNIS